MLQQLLGAICKFNVVIVTSLINNSGPNRNPTVIDFSLVHKEELITALMSGVSLILCISN
jgi:hypothetical protein